MHVCVISALLSPGLVLKNRMRDPQGTVWGHIR